MHKRKWDLCGRWMITLALFWTVGGGECLATSSSLRSNSFPYQPGDTIIVQNDYGRVRIRPGASRDVESQVRLIAQDDQGLANIGVVAQKSGSKIFINTYFYDYRAESAYLEILAPETVNVVVWGANPAVDVSGLSGYVRVYTQTGLITASNLTSSVSLTSDTGDILLRLAKQPEGDLRLETTHGDVRCELRPGLNLRGWTRAGATLDWNREVEFQGGHLEKQLGVGGPLLLATSLRGNVRVDLSLSSEASAAIPPPPARPGTRQPDSRGSGTGIPSPDRQPPTVSDYPTEEPSGSASSTTDDSIDNGAGGSDVDYRTNPDGTVDSGYSLKVNVNWTYLNVSVRDRYNNRSIPSLRESDFLLYEDGVEQTIEKFESAEAPFSLLLLLDVSGSTKSFIDLIQEASIEFTRQIKPNDTIAVAVFNSDVRLIQPFTNDRSRVERSIRRVRSGGGTAFYDALDTSIRDYMSGQEGRKAIVVFTDGVDNQLTGDWSNGSRTTFRELYRGIQEIDTIIYTIFLDTENRVPGQRRNPGRRGSIIDILGDITRGGGGGGAPPPPSGDRAYDEARRELQIIADQTGGRMYSPNDIYDLNHVYGEIADDLRVLYTLGYNSTNTDTDGRWRSIEVRVRNIPDAEVRARKGYYGPGGPNDTTNRRNRFGTP